MKQLAVTTAILLCTLMQPISDQACAQLAGHELLVISIRTGHTEVFVVDPETGDATNISRHPVSSARYPSWSPDGREIAFTSDRDGAYNLYLVQPDGSALRQLTHEKAPAVICMQSWTADGRWIYFGLFGKGDPQMCRMAPEGTEFKVVGLGIDPAVSPDGKRIAFARQLKNGHCLFTADGEGLNVRQLTTRENRFAGVHPTWTPDSQRIVYADQAGEALELFSCDADGQNVTQLTSFGQAATSPAVSPDMQWISFRLCDEIYWRDSASSARAYQEKRADKRPVWIMGIDGSNPHVLECLHYQMTIDGSRASWRPGPRGNGR